MLSQTRDKLILEVPFFVQKFSKEFMAKGASLWKKIHAMDTFDIDLSIMGYQAE
jgi:hypothetical protein